MKKLLLVLFTLCLFLTGCGNSSSSSESSLSEEISVVDNSSESLPDSPSEPDFRDFNWGDSKDYVIEIQGDPYKSEKLNGGNTIISYPNVKINGVDSILYMFFNKENQLYSAYYDISVTSLINSDTKKEQLKYAPYYDVYLKLSKALIEKYGDPINEDIQFDDTVSHNLTPSFGMYIYKGKMSIITAWTNDTTSILLTCTNNNYSLYYLSKEIKESEVADLGV